MIDQVVSEVAEGVHTIRIERVEAMNRLTPGMCDQIADAIAFAESSSRVRAILITGTPGMFCGGHDADALQSFAEMGGIDDSVLRLLKTMATSDKPVVAAVDGPSFGLGTTLLLLCDYVVASEWAIFSLPQAEIGMPPEGGASILAPAIMGYQRAFALLVMGDQFDSHQAMNAGFVNKIVPADAVESAGFETARLLAEKPPEAVRMARRLMRGERRDIQQRIDLEASNFSDLLHSPAARDALQAYIDVHR